MRLRVRFAKIGKIRFIGHRDVARVTERAIRKVGLPVAYSQGYSPRMKLSFGLALPTGYESVAEFVDLPLQPDATTDAATGAVPCTVSDAATGAPMGVPTDAATGLPMSVPTSALMNVPMNAPMSAPMSAIVCRTGVFTPCCDECDVSVGSYCSLAGALTEALPVGMSVSAAVPAPVGGPSLQSAVRSCGWRFEIGGLDADAAADAVEAFLASEVVMAQRQHKGRTVSSDVRAGVADLRVEGSSAGAAVLSAELSAAPRVIRPSELVPVLAPGREMGIARRTHQWTWSDAGRAEPAVPAQCAHQQTESTSRWTNQL